MPATPDPENYTLGRGKLYFNKKDPTLGYLGERDLGNAPDVRMSIDIASLDHFSSRSGIKAKDKKVITEVTPKMTFTLDEMSPDNLALLTLADLEDVTQQAADNQNETLTAVKKDRYYLLAKRTVKYVTLKYKTGTAIHNIGSTLTGALSSATAIIMEVNGDVATGTLILGLVSGGPFQDTEALSDDGGVPGASVADGIEAVVDGVCVTDGEATPTFYTVGTDFTVDATRGRIYIVPTGSIADDDDIDLFYYCAETNYKKIKVLAQTQIEGSLRFISDNPVGPNDELEIWRISLAPSGDTGMISDDWSSMTFDGEILKDETGHPESPYMNIYIE